MKKILLVIGLALLSVSAYSQLKVATYNIRLDKESDRENGNGWEKRAPKICDIVKYHDFALLEHRKYFSISWRICWQDYLVMTMWEWPEMMENRMENILLSYSILLSLKCLKAGLSGFLKLRMFLQGGGMQLVIEL